MVGQQRTMERLLFSAMVYTAFSITGSLLWRPLHQLSKGGCRVPLHHEWGGSGIATTPCTALFVPHPFPCTALLQRLAQALPTHRDGRLKIKKQWQYLLLLDFQAAWLSMFWDLLRNPSRISHDTFPLIIVVQTFCWPWFTNPLLTVSLSLWVQIPRSWSSLVLQAGEIVVRF